MRTLRLALVGLLFAVGLVALTEGPSFACSCVMGGTAKYTRWADTIFTGTLVGIEQTPPAADGTISSGDPVTYRFEVEQELEGDLDSTAEVVSARDSATCGLSGMRQGESYLVFASVEGDRLGANLCGGTQPASNRVVDRVAHLTGTLVVDPLRSVIAAILALFDWPS